MQIRFLILLTFFYFTSNAQVISTSIKDDPKFLTYSQNWALREKTDYSDGENVIRIEKTSNNLLQLGYTARLSTVKHAIIIHRIDAKGKEISKNKIENGDREFGPTFSVPAEFRKRIFLIYFKYDNKDSMRLFLSEVERKSLSLINTRLLFSFQQSNVGILKMTKALEHQIISRLSPDSNKFLIAYQTPANEMMSCVLGEDLNIIRKNISKRIIPEKAVITDAFLENSGNAAFVISEDNYTFEHNPLKGIIMQKLDGKEKYQEFSGNDGTGRLLNCHLSNARDNAKLYLFGDYAGAVGSAGIWMMELESDKLRLSKSSLFPYTVDLMQSVNKLGFGVKRKGEYGILNVQYQLVEFDNGSFALCGTPLLREDNRHMEPGNNMTQGYVEYFAGPVIMAFLEKNRVGKHFGMIPRNQNMSQGSECIYVPYQENLVVIYNDYKANIVGNQSEDKVKQKGGAITKELSLAYAVIDKSGSIKERKLLAEGVSRMNCYNTAYSRKLSEYRYEVPSVSLDKKTDSYKVVDISIE